MKGNKTDWLQSAPVSATNSKAATPLYPFLVRLMRGENLGVTEAADFFRALTDVNANPAQIAGALTALTAKGETADELAGMASVMRSTAIPLVSKQQQTLDITGTGSSPVKTFNVSTAATFVAAGAGLIIAKQCNRGVMSPSGSADVLSELGVKVANEPANAQASLNGAGLCFLFAPKFHPTLRRVGDVRRGLGIRTCLNVLGVLANPAKVKRQLIGVWHPSLVEPVARALCTLKIERAWVVHGSDGLDEITISGPTGMMQVADGQTRAFRISPGDFGLKIGKTGALQTNSAKESAKIICDVLASQRRDEARSLIVINAAAALVIAGIAKDPVHGARLAEQSIDSGQAQNKLERMIQMSNRK